MLYTTNEIIFAAILIIKIDEKHTNFQFLKNGLKSYRRAYQKSNIVIQFFRIKLIQTAMGWISAE